MRKALFDMGAVGSDLAQFATKFHILMGDGDGNDDGYICIVRF